jgi:hypothetical protein
MAVFGCFLAIFAMTFQGIGGARSSAFGTSEITDMSNQYRINAGLAQLTTNQTLTNSAQAKADDMAAKSYFAHNSPDGSVPWDFFAAAGYSYSGAGENLALSNQSAASVVDGWYQSIHHRENMLSAEFTEVGYGIAHVETFSYQSVTYTDVFLVAAHYGTPLNPVPTAAITPPNQPEQTVAQGSQIEQPTPTAPEIIAEKVPEAQPIIAPISTDQTNKTYPNTTTSGRYIAVTKPGFRLSSRVSVSLLGAGLSLAVIGMSIEIRRIIRHQPLLPHIHHHV